MHKDKLKMLKSNEFQFAKVQNQIDSQTMDLTTKINDSIDALTRRLLKVDEIEAAMCVKIKTMLDQSCAAFQIQ